MSYLNSWQDVVDLLGEHPWRTRVQVPKGHLPHPQAAGMTPSSGLPEGQVADYRYLLDGGIGLHVKDFGTHYEAHLDEVHPDVDVVEHLRQDAPHVYVGGAVALGAAVGGLLSKDWKGAVAGAAIAGLLGAALAAAATTDDGSRTRP